MKLLTSAFVLLVMLDVSGCAFAADLIVLDGAMVEQGCDRTTYADISDYSFEPGGGYYGSPYEQTYNWHQLGSFGWLQVLVWVVLAFVGVVFHFYIDVKKGILPMSGMGGLYQYLFVSHVDATVKTLIAIMMACGGWFALNPVPVPWVNLIPAALFFGYGFDSVLNRGLSNYG